MQITSADDLQHVSEQLHDGWIELGDEGVRPTDGFVTLTGWLETERSVVARRLGPFVAERPVTVPFTLTFSEVSDVDLRDGSATGGVAVDGISFDEGTGIIQISGHNDCDLSVAVASISGELTVHAGPSGLSRTVALRWRWARGGRR